MKAALVVAVAVGLASVAATLWVGSRLFEEKVTPDPYQAGLGWDEAQRRAARPDCDLSAGRCERLAGGAGARVTLEVEPRPLRSMRDLTFTVSARQGALPVADAEADLRLAMPGMFMGENRVRLVHLGGGVYRGRGVIVRCPSGGRTWSAEVTLRRREPPAAAPVAATFTFDVAD